MSTQNEDGSGGQHGGGGAIVRDGMGGEVQKHAPTAIQGALEAQATTREQARWLMAAKRPRSVRDFRQKMVLTCRDPFFAEVCEYQRPVGKEKEKDKNGVETGRWIDKIAKGPSVHFVREALKVYGNCDVHIQRIHEDAKSVLSQVTVTDYETNFAETITVSVEKTEEKKKLPKIDGKEIKPLGVRTNTYGEIVYLVEAQEDRVRVKEANYVARALRTAGLAILPKHVVDDCMAVAREAREAKFKADPDAARKKLCDDFAVLGVMPSDLEQYIAAPLEKITPEQFQELLAVKVSLRDDGLRWAEALEASPYVAHPEGGEETPEQTKAREAIEKNKEDLRRKREEKKKIEEAKKAAAQQQGAAPPPPEQPPMREPGED